MEYLNKLKPNELLEILNKCGLFVVDDIKNIKKDADETNADCYYLRAIAFDEGKNNNVSDSVSDLIKYIQLNANLKTKNKILHDHIDMFMENDGFMSYSQDSLVDMYAISDFMLYRIALTDIFNDIYPNESDWELQKKFYMTMCQKFKSDGYMDSYRRFVTNLDESMNCNM